MNTKSKILLSLGLLAAPLALTAKSPESAYVESYQGRADIPVPVSVVMPEVSSRYIGEQVIIEFVVDELGKPTLLTSAKADVDSELLTAVLAAVAQWQFAPAVVDGKPMARKVMLPVMIVNQSGTTSPFSL
jgi:TonB family protein